MKPFFPILFLFIYVSCTAQHRVYTTANAHSHNDYEKASPFWEAWKHEFGSIEADIFLDNGELVVAHDREQVKKRFTLDSLYLKPLQQCINANKGYVYGDSLHCLQLMIDIKTEAIPTLKALVERLEEYPSLLKCRTLTIVISGNRPPLSDFDRYPEFILFDGELQKEYTQKQLERVPMFSDNFAKYSSWKGDGQLPQNSYINLQNMIKKVHAMGKKIRFWNAPDNLNTWKLFAGLGVDYLNTDHIPGISQFLQHQ